MKSTTSTTITTRLCFQTLNKHKLVVYLKLQHVDGDGPNAIQSPIKCRGCPISQVTCAGCDCSLAMTCGLSYVVVYGWLPCLMAWKHALGRAVVFQALENYSLCYVRCVASQACSFERLVA